MRYQSQKDLSIAKEIKLMKNKNGKLEFSASTVAFVNYRIKVRRSHYVGCKLRLLTIICSLYLPSNLLSVFDNAFDLLYRMYYVFLQSNLLFRCAHNNNVMEE